MITTVNFHLTKACNFRCKYCFARFNDIRETSLSKPEQLELISQLYASGKFRKINFAGGEPTLVPHIVELIQHAKWLGFETSIVTNGSQIDFEWVKNISSYLDILAVSVDSINPETNIKIGSNHIENSLFVNKLRGLATACSCFGVQLKINTVVSKFNQNEVLTDFINEIKPFRWKILQATKIEGQNDTHFGEFSVSLPNFEHFFILNKKGILPKIKIITENNELIKGSYIMVDCLGRFFDNSKNRHSYSDRILKVGVDAALSQINTDSQKFVTREGNYTIIKTVSCTF